jgi:tRNA threonylcarbamoyl adenosine modification protein YeaZ
VSKLLLALDTATERTTVGLARLESAEIDMFASAVVDAPRAAMSRLLPMAETLLSSHNLTIAEVEGVIVGRGPGSFTGVRIGVATAKGLAHGLGCPLGGVGTLDAIAWGMCNHDATLGIVGDAMRGEVYPALFRCGHGRVERLTSDRAAKPEEVAAEWAARCEPILLAGNGLRKYAPIFIETLGQHASVADEDAWAPHPAGLFEAWADLLASDAHGSGEPGDLLPVYTRLSDAEENERVRAGLAPADTPDSGVAGGEGR